MSDKPPNSREQHRQQLIEQLAETYGTSVTEFEKAIDEWNKEYDEEIRQVCGVDLDKQFEELLEEQNKMVEKLIERRQRREKEAEATEAADNEPIICQLGLSPNAIREYHSPAWHQPVTPEEIEYCEKEFGHLVNTLAELANLVREAARCAEPSLDPNKYYIAYPASGDDPGTDEPIVLSPNTYQLVLRAHISARYLGPLIEMIVGKKHATEFYDRFRNVLTFVPNSEGHGWAWLPAENKNIAQTLEQFHRISLLLVMPEKSEETGLERTIMLDGKILDRARQLIKARLKKRQRLFPDELSSKLRGLQLSGNHPLESSTGRKIIRNFFTEELENRAPVIWKSLQQAHEALGSQLTDTRAFDLKEAATQFLSEITKELSEFMMKQAGFTKDDIANSTLNSAKNDACEKIDIEVDLYVNSLTKKPAGTGQEIKTVKEPENVVSLPKHKWEDIYIEVIDGHKVKVKIDNQVYDKSFSDLGFADNRCNPEKPNRLWDIFLSLAEKSSGRRANAVDIKKHDIKRIRRTLESHFNINESPISDYLAGCWPCKFKFNDPRSY